MILVDIKLPITTMTITGSCCHLINQCDPWFLPDVYEKSQAMLVDELGRCRALGLSLYNFHPGSSLGTITTDQCIQRIAGAVDHAHRQVPAVVTGRLVSLISSAI